jgi:type I restriction enzyme S subunit
MTYKPLSMVPFTHPWPEMPLGDVATVVVGGTPSTDVPAYWGGDIPWMASGDVHQKRITDVEGRITSLGLRSSNATLVEPPSVAVALAGQGKTRGTAAKVLTRACFQILSQVSTQAMATMAL